LNVENVPLRKPGCRPWVPPALLVGSAVALDTAMAMSVLVPDRADGGMHVRGVIASASGVVAAVLLVVGIVLAVRWAGTEEPKFVGWYTVLLLVLGILGVLPMLLFEWMLRRAQATSGGESIPAFRFVQAVIAAYSTALLVTVVLRAMRSRAAAALTTCVSLCLLPLFPFGTAFGVVWLAAARTQETSPS